MASMDIGVDVGIGHRRWALAGVGWLAGVGAVVVVVVVVDVGVGVGRRV